MLALIIYNEGKGGPDNKYAPKPDPDAKNYDLDKAVLDGLGAIGESFKAPSADDIGQRAESLASGAEKAMGTKDAAESATNKQDTVVTTNNKGSNGETFNAIYVIKGKDTIDQRSYVPSSMLPKNK